jgi:hypothetical protein
MKFRFPFHFNRKGGIMLEKTVIRKNKPALQGKFAPFTLDFTFKKAFANEQCRSNFDRLLFTFKNAHKLSKKPSSFEKLNLSSFLR